ncbi:MAG TPA: helix-hairpin-helix domain-containing protein, partial [Chitinophagales bacterium]|nr:helix-hairpin-helix domain-containing protein [Chitinophagales bacterium]
QKSDKYSSNDAIKKEYTSKAYKFPQNKFFTIEINSATVEDFEKLNGIGKVYANRIVTFRNKLGGFHSIEQIKHVFGIEDSVFQKFKRNLTVKPIKPKKININQATFEELTANPYFFSTVAKQIIGYRTKVKPFSTIEDVKNLYFVKDHPEHYDKMLPYIAID